MSSASTAALPSTDGESRSSAESERDPVSELNNQFSRFSVVSKAESRLSRAFSDRSGSFCTAPSRLSSTRNSVSTYLSAFSGRHSYRESVITLNPESNFERRIREAGLKPSPLDELDWSGRGQFVEFNAGETVPLEYRREISSTSGAIVEEVICRQIRLARKSMICRPESRLKSALEEIRHLRQLDYAHIVRIVGAYVQGITISILTYPVAEWDLESFLLSFQYVSWGSISTLDPDEASQSHQETLRNLDKKHSLVKMPSCLIRALAFVHSNSIRHLDIKPKNILVRKAFGGSHLEPADWSGVLGDILIDRHLRPPYKVYLCDFGISTSFNSDHDTKTTSPTARTATYCAPEIDEDGEYSRAADIFSLGCVFAEIFTCSVGETLKNFVEARAGLTPGSKARVDKSFQGNLSRVFKWLIKLVTSSNTADLDLLALDLVFAEFDPNNMSKRGSLHIFGDPAPRELWRQDESVEGLKDGKLKILTYPVASSVFASPQNVYFVDILLTMLRGEPSHRPSSALLVSKAKHALCCDLEGEPFSRDTGFVVEDNPPGDI